jgi:hypothetical protein
LPRILTSFSNIKAFINTHLKKIKILLLAYKKARKSKIIKLQLKKISLINFRSDLMRNSLLNNKKNYSKIKIKDNTIFYNHLMHAI